MGRVALIGENSTKYVEILLDIWNGGNCAVLINWKTPYDVVCEMITDAAVTKCYIDSKISSKWKKFFNDIECVEYSSDSEKAQLLPQRIYDKFEPNYSLEEALVIYSSGTTGKSKGIILSHYAINVNADAIIEYMNLSNDDRLYISKDFSHSSTMTGELLVALKTRVALVIAPTIVPPRYVFEKIEKFKISIICINPTLLTLYVEEQLSKRHSIDSLKKIYVSGSTLSNSLYWKAHSCFNRIKLYNAYGLSEAGPRVSVQRENCCKNNSVGKPIDGVDVKIIDELGHTVLNESIGVIHVKTKSMFSGYIVGEAKNKSLYENWLNTGDVGYFDRDGELHVLNRIDDMIVINSQKIYPSEIEEKISLLFSTVLECAVVKVKINDKEVLACAYNCSDETELEPYMLVNHLMTHEIPKIFVKCLELPKTATGKVIKNAVIELINTNYKL